MSVQLMTYTSEHLSSWHQLINTADQVDNANLACSLESLSRLADMTDPEDICLAFASGQLIGYVRLEWQSTERPRVGCFGIVHPEFRRRGVGTALVRWALARLKDTAAGRQVSFYIPVRHSVQGLEQLVNSLEMQPTSFFHVLQYSRLPELPPDLEGPSGIELRTFTGEKDLALLVAAHNRVFGPQLSEQELIQLTADSGFVPELWSLAFANNGLVGFCMCTEGALESEIAYLGVLPEYRRLGLGAALLTRGVRALAARGQQNIHLAVNVKNEQALSLYHRLGFAPWRRSTTYELRLPG